MEQLYKIMPNEDKQTDKLQKVGGSVKIEDITIKIMLQGKGKDDCVKCNYDYPHLRNHYEYLPVE
jgi:hypothetical protein